MGCTSKNCAFAMEAGGSKVTNDDIEQRITKFIKSFRYVTPESEIMYELWKI